MRSSAGMVRRSIIEMGLSWLITTDMGNENLCCRGKELFKPRRGFFFILNYLIQECVDVSFLPWSTELARGQIEPFISSCPLRERSQRQSRELAGSTVRQKECVLAAQPSEKDQMCPSLREADLYLAAVLPVPLPQVPKCWSANAGL